MQRTDSNICVPVKASPHPGGEHIRHPPFLPLLTLSNAGGGGGYNTESNENEGKRRKGEGQRGEEAGERVADAMFGGETGTERAMCRRGEVRGEDGQHICPLPLWAAGAPTPPWHVMPAQVWGSSSAGTLAAGPRVPPHSSLSRPCWSTIHHPGQNRPWKHRVIPPTTARCPEGVF